MKAVTDIKRHEIIPKEGRIPLSFYNSVSPVVGSPPASGLGCEPNPFYLFLWVLTTNVLHIAICLSLQMFKLHILAQQGPPCLCSSSKFPVWVPLFCHYLSCLVSSFLFFHTFLVFWLQFMTCVDFTALFPVFLMFLFPESISLLIDYSIFSIFNLLTLFLSGFLSQSAPSLNSRLLPSYVMCQMLWCFFHISHTSTSLEHQQRNTLRL